MPALSRRSFLQAGAASVLGAASWSRVYGANETLRVAAIGVGGKGWYDITHVSPPARTSRSSPCATSTRPNSTWAGRPRSSRTPRRFTDWRRLLDTAKDFDAVIVSTPDHMHAPIALPAMQLGKHVYCQKPLTHTVFEARQMRQAAEKYGVVTQMGNQIQSHAAYRTAVKLVHDGAIGKVKEVHSWQAGPMRWLLVDDRPAGADPVPEVAALGRLARRRPGAALQGEDLPPAQLAGLAGLQQRPARRLRLPHPRPGLHGPRADRAAHDPGRGAAAATARSGHAGRRCTTSSPAPSGPRARRSS